MWLTKKITNQSFRTKKNRRKIGKMSYSTINAMETTHFKQSNNKRKEHITFLCSMFNSRKVCAWFLVFESTSPLLFVFKSILFTQIIFDIWHNNLVKCVSTSCLCKKHWKNSFLTVPLSHTQFGGLLSILIIFGGYIPCDCCYFGYFAFLWDWFLPKNVNLPIII